MKHSTMMLPKFKRLARLLGGTVMAAGTLEVLWRTCDHIERFVFSPGEVEDICEWDGEPGRLVAVLVDCRWLDQGADGALMVHDYLENAPEFIRDRNRMREARARKRAEASEQSRTVPNTGEHARTCSVLPYTDTDTEGSVKKADTDGATHDRRVGKGIGAAGEGVGRSVGVSAKLGGSGQVPNLEAVGEVLGRVARRLNADVEAMAGRTPGAGGRAAAGARSGCGSGVEAGAGGSSLVGAVGAPEGKAPRRRRLTAEQVAEKAGQIVRITGESAVYREWWGDVVRRADQDPAHAAVLVEAVQYAAMCGDPAQRRAKDLGELKKPGAFIAKRLMDAGMRLPPKPAVRAARPGARGVA